MRLCGAGQESLGKRLIKALTIGMDIDATKEIEHTELVTSGRFLRTIAHIEGGKDEEVKGPDPQTDGLQEQSFWIDGSPLYT